MADPFVEDLRANLAFHRAWVVLIEQYQRRQPKPDVAAMLEDLLQVEHETVELLAQALRQQGVPPALVGVREKILSDGLMRSNFRSRMQYVHVGLQRSRAWYEQRLENAGAPEQEQKLWQALYDLQAPIAERVRALLSQIETS